MITFLGCGVESDSSVSLSSSITINVDNTGSETNETDSNETDPDPEPSVTELNLFSSEPFDTMEDVEVDSSTTLIFNNGLDLTTVNEASFSFTKNGTNVLFSVESSSDNEVTLKTDEVMEFDSTYVVFINSGLKDIYSNSISGTTSISFTTASEVTIPVVVTPSIYDENACKNTGTYTNIKDNSFDPGGFYDAEEGIKLTSYYPKLTLATYSEARLFHPRLDGEVNGDMTLVWVPSEYSFSFDSKWLENSNRTIYIKSPVDADEQYTCYRYELNTTNRDDMTRVLVHGFEE